MKILVLTAFVAVLAGILYAASTNPPTVVKCDAKGAIAAAVFQVQGLLILPVIEGILIPSQRGKHHGTGN